MIDIAQRNVLLDGLPFWDISKHFRFQEYMAEDLLEKGEHILDYSIMRKTKSKETLYLLPVGGSDSLAVRSAYYKTSYFKYIRQEGIYLFYVGVDMADDETEFYEEMADFYANHLDKEWKEEYDLFDTEEYEYESIHNVKTNRCSIYNAMTYKVLVSR